MAIVKFGPTVVGARGTIAGTVFSANKSGPFARGWSRGSNPRSALQSAHRGVIGSMATTWRALTQAQRDDWIDYADDLPQQLTNSLGEDYFASGFNWYVRINEHLLANGDSLRVDAPTLARIAAPLTPTLVQLRATAGIGVSRIKFQPASPGLSRPHAVFARITTQGRTAVAHNFVFLILAIPDGIQSVFFQTELEASFGNIVLGQRMFWTAQSQDADGQRSPTVSGFTDAFT